MSNTSIIRKDKVSECFQSIVYIEKTTFESLISRMAHTSTIVFSWETVDIFIERFKKIFMQDLVEAVFDFFFPLEWSCLLCSDRGIAVTAVLKTISTRKGREEESSLCVCVKRLSSACTNVCMHATGSAGSWNADQFGLSSCWQVPRSRRSASSSSPFRVPYNR
jgi:hypothetical protein